jgi:hypothetical protein
LSLDRFEQYSFWLDISHSGLCLEVLAFMALPAIPIWVMSHHVLKAHAGMLMLAQGCPSSRLLLTRV